MKYKITEMNSNYQEVQVGTCSLKDLETITLEQ